MPKSDKLKNIVFSLEVRDDQTLTVLACVSVRYDRMQDAVQASTHTHMHTHVHT